MEKRLPQLHIHGITGSEAEPVFPIGTQMHTCGNVCVYIYIYVHTAGHTDHDTDRKCTHVNNVNTFIMFLSLANEDEGRLVEQVYLYRHTHCVDASSSRAQMLSLRSSCHWIPSIPIGGTWTYASPRPQPYSSR